MSRIANDTGIGGSVSENLCRECKKPIPPKAKRCTNDNCGAYQDWRRFLVLEPTLVVSLITLVGIIVTIIFNFYQMRDLARKADKQDIKQIQEDIKRRIPQLSNEIRSLEAQLLSVPDEFTNRYKRFLESPNTGIIKILPSGKYEQVMLMRGGGAYYSFSRETHEYGYGSDINLQQGMFAVGFAGADYGFFLQLGDVPIQDIPSSESNLPSWLDPQHKNAWSHMWLYKPPPELADLRLEFRAYSQGVKIDGVTLTSQVPAREQTTYLLRSLNILDSDILAAFRAEAKLEDGSFILVWKILRQFDVPIAIGPDLQE